jgi:hypothetical protein
MARGRRPDHGDFRPLYHPAGFDDALRLVLDDLRTGRWMSMRQLLLDTGEDWALRTSRTQVLAAAAARSAAVRAWRAEQPGSPDAVVMRARVAVERVLQAGRRGHRGVTALAEEARESCHVALRYAGEEDPVPWVCLLALAQLDDQQLLPEHQWSPPDVTLPSGPWGLWHELSQRDPYNREGHHRILQFLQVRAGGSRHAEALHFAHWVVTWAPPGSPLLVLPLHAYAGRHRARRQRAGGATDPLARQQWLREHVQEDVDRALRGWFERSEAASRALPDLSHLAHALWSAARFAAAAPVFEAMGAYGTRQPWAQITDDPDRADLAERAFVLARSQCLAAGETARKDRPEDPPNNRPRR